uniref:protein cordon-bleu isoform X1 n=1 Tax=Doryrhamphus excisus TaxID=161450 RepID=UPI0025AEB90E|nr:protein cordon-bleu isoform X1 [Doryrhamphus excisus]XP_057909628.1 protein cordon-bleu isoform X1 [Doryrhamphus excisus]XP_057909629.1 protein cordon-bleu isoform X1 [Doryrhamphus excisus]
MKARAPPPPQAPQPAPRHIFTNPVPDGGGTPGMDFRENIMTLTVDFELTLPQGYRTSVTEDGSKALMDLLVDLCSRYHLNPALHTLELLSPEGHSLGFKPNALLGSLNVAFVLIKEKAYEEKVVRRLAPKAPEKTVRLMVNYHGGQKAVVRVNPLVPLQALIPVICEKCELDPRRVQLLKDSISRDQLPLDKSLAQLGIKELYVLDQGRVLHQKTASTPALNYSDSTSSISSTSLDRGSKKGLFGFFQFGRRKSKTETSSFGMDDCHDKSQYADQSSYGLSTRGGPPGTEDRSHTLTQSQSVVNVLRTSPKLDTKKRRAPAPPPGPLVSSMGHSHSEADQTGYGSESQQRKRKAPSPPSTGGSITPDDHNGSTSATPTPDNHTCVKPSPALRTKTAHTNSATSTTVTAVRPQSLRIEVQPPSVVSGAAKRGSLTPSSSTSDSQVIQDSSSEVSHCLDDSDLDTDTTSRYSTLTSSNASGSVQIQTPAKTSKKKRELEMAGNASGKSVVASTSISGTESEVETNGHSATGTADPPAPPKPRRSPAREHPTVSTPSLHSPSFEPIESGSPRSAVEKEDTAPQSWLHSMQSTAAHVKDPGNRGPEEERLSLGSSSGSSLPDQGYAASEGMVDGDDSGLVSSPSDTHPTSPEGSLFLERSDKARREKESGPVRDISSDSDEGCATWNSNDSHIKLQAKSGRVKGTYEDKYKWLHQANLAADLSAIHRVPVSVVDMDIPVTAIDEIVDDHQPGEGNTATVLTDMKLSHRKGSEGAAELRNKNNNACTASTKSIVNAKHVSKPDQYRMPLEKGPSVDSKDNTIYKRARDQMTKDVKDDKQSFSVNKSPESSNNMIKNQSLRSDLKSKADCLPQDSSVRPHASQRSLSTEGGGTHSVYPNSSSNVVQRKVTCNPTSRFGMKTFTVVPPKPSVMQGAPQIASAPLTAGAIKIDEQGNIMKCAGGHHSKGVEPTQSGIPSTDGAPLLGKAKAFWSSSECSGPCSKGVTDKAKGSLENLKTSETTLSTDRRELVKTQHRLNNPTECTQFKETDRKTNQSTTTIVSAKQQQAEVNNNTSVPAGFKQPPLAPDLHAFLKTSRCTSSQYVASAINKYTPKTATKTNIVSFPSQSSPLTQPKVAFRSLGHSIQVNPRQSSKISLIDNKMSQSEHPGPVRSKSYPEFVSDSQRQVREDKGGNCVESTQGSSWSLGLVSDKIKHFQSSGVTQTTMTDGGVRQVQNYQCRSPTTSHSSRLHSSSCLTAADPQPQPLRRMSDSAVTQEPSPVNLFGPVKKFRPVICRSIERETSLHTNLMEAIQASGGKDRLKKISSSGPRSKEASSDDGDRSALFSAIRAQSCCERLRKTKSEAAEELQRFRMAASEEQQREDFPSPSSASLAYSSPVFASPPLLLPTMFASHQQPPSFVHQVQQNAVARPSANAFMNPVIAREAMMEAIRSGSAAEKLKKVAAPTKTVQVNGRLGTICSSSKLSQ